MKRLEGEGELQTSDTAGNARLFVEKWKDRIRRANGERMPSAQARGVGRKKRFRRRAKGDKGGGGGTTRGRPFHLGLPEQEKRGCCPRMGEKFCWRASVELQGEG